MRNLPRYRDEMRTRWRTLLEDLSRHEERLADGYLSQIENGDKYYDGLVDSEDLRKAARQAFRYLLCTMLGRDPDEQLAAFPGEIGARRARQGVPLENLLSAIRSDFMVAWSALLRLARASDMPVLAAHAGELWQAVDGFASRVQVGYLDERIALARSSLIQQRQFLSRLFQPPGPGARQAGIIATALGLDPDEAYWVAVTASHQDPERAFASVTEQLRVVRHPHFLHDHRDRGLLLFPATGRWQAEATVVAELLDGIACALGPRARTLTDVHRGAEVAFLLAIDGRAKSPTTVRNGWCTLTVEQLAPVIDTVRDYVLAPLAACVEAERDNLIATISAFARHGTIQDTADEMYCHRNTVLKRMRRFEELTGLDLRRPGDISLTLLTLLPTKPMA